jgi:hypothetical protein
VFVVLDNVHYTKQHYLDRARIINMHGEVSWLSLPTGQNLGRTIADVTLRPPNSSSIQNLIRTIQGSYAKALQFEIEWPFIERLLRSSLSKPAATLLEIDIALVEGLLAHLRIPLPRIIMASAISTACGGPTQRLTEISQALGIKTLITGAGRSGAVHDMRALQEAGVEILVQDYAALHPRYSQSRRRRAVFVPGLSVIDALFNVGVDAVKTFLSDSRYAPVLASSPPTPADR